MRTLDENRKRWTETFKDNGDLAALRQAVEAGGSSSPCEAGCRSVCWKVFLLFRDVPASERNYVLCEAREDYDKLRGRYLQYIKHPELLAELTVDPLADDPESPWDTFRHDEVIRAEILQDVRRLPDDPFYHQEEIQTLILDILFIYCKENPDVGGYRQGMHELLAPLVYVLNEDAVDKATGLLSVSEGANAGASANMEVMLDRTRIEHDAYALFAKIMSRAKSFYETSSTPAATASNASATPGTLAATDPALPASVSELLPAISPSLVPTIVSGNAVAGAIEESTIVELSKEIHEGSLMKVDPELALHLKDIEILPQIFLIRWIRLLFGREFPFDQHLVLWDSIFAFDPKLNLVPLICVAMLLRIRWQLIDADYSVALQSLLKYPAPELPYGPHTFVGDAIFLRDHLDAAGGAELILKYTGKSPSRSFSPLGASSASTRQPTPAAAFAAGLGSLRSRTLNMARSPLRASRPGSGSGDNSTAGPGEASPSSSNTALSPSRFIQRREGVEALFQGARNVFERGEKLGINQAVRDAMGEIKRNVSQGLQEAKQAAAQAQRNTPSRAQGQLSGFSSPLLGSASVTSGRRRLSYGETMRAISDMEHRNRQLALMLDETIVSLKGAAKSATLQDTDVQEYATSDSELQKAKQQQWAEEVEIAAAKVQFVKVYLEDPSLILPVVEPEAEPESVPTETLEKTSTETTLAAQGTPAITTTAEVVAPVEDETSTDFPPPVDVVQPAVEATAALPKALSKTPLMQTQAADTDVSSIPPLTEGADNDGIGIKKKDDVESPKASLAEAKETKEATREAHTVPARSSLAQSSFAWMLEPGDTPASVSTSANNAAASASQPAQPSSGPAKKSGPSRPSPAARTRHAFLFGDSAGQSPLVDSVDPLADTTDPSDQNRPAAKRANSEVFGLEPLKRASKDKE